MFIAAHEEDSVSESNHIQEQLTAAIESVELPDDPQARDIAVRWPIAATAQIDSDSRDVTGRVTIYNMVGPKACVLRSLLDVSGTSRTNSAGTATFRLNEFLCLRPGTARRLFEAPINIVVTPRSEAPAILTAKTEIASNTADVTITVWSWKLVDGSPLPGISFYWRCLAPFTSEIV